MVGTFFNFSILLFIRRKHRSEDRNSVNFFFFFFLHIHFRDLNQQFIYNSRWPVNIIKQIFCQKHLKISIPIQKSLCYWFTIKDTSPKPCWPVQSQVLSQNDPNPQSNLTLDQFDFVYNSLRLIIIKKYSIKKYFVNINSDSMASWL